MEAKTMKDVSQVKETQDGVIIEVVDENVDPSKVEQVVERCKTGQCSCMSEEMKQKISFMDFSMKNGKPIIEIKGDITKEDIKYLGPPTVAKAGRWPTQEQATKSILYQTVKACL